MTTNDEYYRLERDAQESVRLTLQHFLWKSTYGWSLHPHAFQEPNLECPDQWPRIADIACGTGVWTIDVSHTLASYAPEVVGFDIKDDFFPPKHDWPAGVSFELWNMFEPPPERYEGYFDVVHIRLVSATISNGDPRPVSRSALKLLKPGGFLQWNETDTDSPDAPAGSAWFKLTQIFKSRNKKHDSAWIPKLDHIFHELGLEQVVKDQRLPQHGFRRYWFDNFAVVSLFFNLVYVSMQ